MLQASNKCIVLYSKSKDKDRYSDHVFNSARVSFGALGDFKKVPNNRTVKACIDCHSIPSRKDEDWLWSGGEYKKNYDLYNAQSRLDKQTLEGKPGADIRVWMCRFCGRHQLVNIKDHVFMDKNLAFKVESHTLHQKNREPVIIFVIDWSSSMQQLVLSDEQIYKKKGNDLNNEKTRFDDKNKTLLNLFNNSSLAVQLKKIEAGLYTKAQELKVEKGFLAKKKQNFVNICKNHLLLGIIEKVLRKIKQEIENNKDQIRRKFGFLFFNDFIFVTGDCTNPEFPIISNAKECLSEESLKFYLTEKGSQKSIFHADYTSFEAMFELGVDNAGSYNNYVEKCDVRQMRLDGIIPEGKTALGPALAMALGIVSQHGEGSNIMVITDGLANNGLLSCQKQGTTSNKEDIEKIAQRLNKHKCRLGILQWRDHNNHRQNPLDILVRSKDTLVTKFQVNLDVNQEKILKYIENILDLAFYQRIQNEIMSVEWRHNVDFVKFEKSKKDAEKPHQEKSQKELISSKSVVWMDIKVEEEKIQQFYFGNNPIDTQLLITLDNIDNKQRWCYVSQVSHFLSKNQKSLSQANYELTKERIERYQVEGNSFRFNEQDMYSVNHSLCEASPSFRKAMDLDDMSSFSAYNKSSKYGMSYFEDPE